MSQTAMDSGGGGGESSRASSSFIKKGDRQLFKVELRPGETTIVSWKKLLKDANKVNGSSGKSGNLPAAPRPGLESRLAPGQPADIDKDAPPAHRFSAVIEKIERLYTGKDSSDEEDLNGIPDDDQYDTEDSFIDDAELDEYFEVDNSAIKHDGFFINRGKLERIEPPVQPSQQPKKRRRRDLGKTQGEGDDGCVSNKLLKVGRTAAGKATSLLAGNSHAPSQSLVPAVLPQNANINSQLGTSETAPRKKAVDAKLTMDPYYGNKVTDCGSSSLSLSVSKDLDKQKIGNFHSKNPGKGLKAIAGDYSISHQKDSGKSVSGIQIITTNEHKLSPLAGEKKGTSERPHAGVGSNCPRPMKNQHMQKKDASNVRPKISMLEKAIRELEKIVAESRPPIVDNQEADASSQAVKRRLPREVKQKLAKVARLAQASHGKITKEVLSRLMSILGHLIQLRTLKRNLKEMISSGLSAKQEKDAKFQHIKKELSEMIKVQVPLLESKAMEPQAGESDDFQDVGTYEKGVHGKHSMDAALENKICDLYDLFVDGLDEDAGPQLRKLYAELVKLWPNGLMDNHGIKQAIYKARDRRRALYSRQKEEEKIKRKKILVNKSEETVRAEAGPVVQSHKEERLATDSGNQELCSVPGDTVVLAINATNPVTSTTAPVRVSSSSTDGASSGRLKQEMFKGGTDDMRVSDDTLLRKKAKRKPEVELDHVRPEKSSTLPGQEIHKSQKQATGLTRRISQQQAAPRLNSEEDVI